MGSFNDIKIPPLPMVVIQVMKYDYEDEAASIHDMEKIIEPDKGITAEILRVANSAYYGRSGRVRSLFDAISLLGIKTLKNLVIFISTRGFSKSLKGETFNRYINEYPILAALYAREIAMKKGGEDLANVAFLSGLLHKIGMTVLAVNKEDHYGFLIEQAVENSFDLKDLERSSYGHDHVEIGLELARNWKLPDEIISVMEIDGTTPVGSVSNELQKIALASAWLGGRSAGIALADRSVEIDQCLQSLGLPLKSGILLAPGFVSELKKHPYYEMALS